MANFGNAATRLADAVPSDGAFARGADPDVDALFQQQSRETDRKKREAMLHQIQQLLYDRARFGPRLRVHLGRAASGRAWPSPG